MHGGDGDRGGLDRGSWDQRGQKLEKNAFLLCGGFCDVTTLQGSQLLLSPFNQASCKAVISLFKYSAVECSHIHNLMTLIMHISEKSTWHAFAGIC